MSSEPIHEATVRANRRPLLRQLRGQLRISRNKDIVQREDGASLVEFAVSFSLFMTLIFVLLETCIAFYTYGMISECSREATRWAIVRGSTCVTSASTSCTATTTTVSSHATGMGFPNPGGGTINATTTYPDGNEAPGSRVKVAISYTFPIRIPFVPKTSLALSTASEMYILQ